MAKHGKKKVYIKEQKNKFLEWDQISDLFHSFVVLFPKEKLGIDFYIRKKTIPGVGAGRGGYGKRPLKTHFLFGTLPLL